LEAGSGRETEAGEKKSRNAVDQRGRQQDKGMKGDIGASRMMKKFMEQRQKACPGR
jgi:hypothetical protein